MAHTYICIDFYNNAASCRINGVDRVFSSTNAFIYGARFPYYENARILAYEPDRNIYVVEYLDGHVKHGADLPEMIWLAENLNNIEAAAIQDEADDPARAPMTVAEVRNGKLAMTDWVLIRKQEEDLLNLPNTMSAEKFAEVLVYRQALRDITKRWTAINSVVWPTNPLE
jgi:hypothetical protein